MAADPRLGVTVTMSNDPPTKDDLKLDEALLQELKSRNEFEAQEETGRRYVESYYEHDRTTDR
jgi:poly(A) polymerase Pap1